jgi:hypothetical protein
VFAEWALLEGAFQATFGLDLLDMLPAKSWRWLFTRIRYLMASDNPLVRRIAPTPESPDAETPELEL